MNLDFTKKRVLVTGGAIGIGRGIVEAFLKAGASVVLNDVNKVSAAKAQNEIDAKDRLSVVVGSVSTPAECKKIVEAAAKALGGLDILINNAGVNELRFVKDTEEEDWNRLMDPNLKGSFFISKYAFPFLNESKGCIVNISSIYGERGVAQQSVYCISKAGMLGMTRAHAIEFAPNVRVNAVCPGGVDTDAMRESAIEIGGTVEAGYKKFLEGVKGLQRIADVSEVAGPVLYLASNLASYISGTSHVLDGGESIAIQGGT